MTQLSNLQGTALRQRMSEDMILAGLSSGTQKLYISAVRALAAWYMRSPDLIREDEVRAYLLEMRDGGVARGTFKTNHYGIRFLYCQTLNRDWPLFGKKRFGSRSRSGCPTRSRRIGFTRSWPPSPTRPTEPAFR